MNLYVDFETAYKDPNDTPSLKTHGPWAYCGAVWPVVVAWALGDGPVRTVVVRDPADGFKLGLFKQDAQAATNVVAHNLEFDALVWDNNRGLLGPRPAGVRCTAVLARLLGLPGGLGNLAKRTLGEGKDDGGAPLVAKLVKCQELDGDELARLAAYAAKDTELCRRVHVLLCDLWDMVTGYKGASQDTVWKEFWHSMAINRIGVPLDMGLVAEQADMSRADKLEADKLVADATGKHRYAATQTQAALRYMTGLMPAGFLPQEPGKSAQDIKAVLAVARSVRPALVPALEAMLRMVKTSNAKWKAARERARDGRFKMGYMFASAVSGRWSCKGLQLHNFPRLGQLGDSSHCEPRQMVAAPPGRKLVYADFTQIELRLTLCLAGESGAVSALARGEDLYSHIAAQVFNKRREGITKDERFVGKMAVLGLGYGAGVKTLATALDAAGASGQLARKCHIAYHATLPRVRQAWASVANAVASATQGRKAECCNGLAVALPVGAISAVSLMLPSGRPLVYHGARVSGDGLSYLKPEGVRVETWGGTLFQNICQAAARDILAEAMVAFGEDQARPPDAAIVAHVHDELIVECAEPDEKAVAALLSRVMSSSATADAVSLPLEAVAGTGQWWGE